MFGWKAKYSELNCSKYPRIGSGGIAPLILNLGTRLK